MYKYIIFFILFNTSLYAPPNAFPPTAFQLAQILDYMHKPIEFKDNLKKLSASRRLDNPNDLREAWAHEVAMNLSQSFPEVPNWTEFVKFHVSQLTQKDTGIGFMPSFFREHLFINSFREPETVAVIIRAIEAEESAEKKGSVVLWRFSAKTPEKERDIEDSNLSFSLGLFSGFLFEGYQYFDKSHAPQACTFSLWASKAQANRLKKEGPGEFGTRLRRLFPEYFKSHADIADSLDRGVISSVDGLLPLLSDMEKWHDEMDFKAEYVYIRDVLFDERLAMKGRSLSINVFGIEIDNITFNTIREESELDSQKPASSFAHFTHQRGKFLPAHYAVAGAGELFHPKCPFPSKAPIRSIVIADCEEYDEGKGCIIQ